MRNPKTPAEWQCAVDMADFHLRVDAARQYGLIETGGLVINTERCLEIIAEGRERGYTPAAEETS